jgi:hypothetical protein
MIRGSCLCGEIRFEYARAVTQVGIPEGVRNAS